MVKNFTMRASEQKDAPLESPFGVSEQKDAPLEHFFGAPEPKSLSLESPTVVSLHQRPPKCFPNSGAFGSLALKMFSDGGAFGSLALEMVSNKGE